MVFHLRKDMSVLKKVLYIATVVKTHIMQFHVPYLKMLKENGWETAVAARNDYKDPRDCAIPFCDTYFDIPFVRNPFHLQNIKAYRKLKRIIKKGQYDVVHCQTPVGGFLGRLAALSSKRKGTKVIYTAHGFHFYKGAPLINWLLYYPVERWLARYTDVLITINKEDYARAQKFRAKKVCHVPGVGVDLSKFYPDEQKRESKRKEFGFTENDFVLLSVGELNKNKNHKIILEAIAKLKGTELYEHLHYMICGQGILREQLENWAQQAGIADRVHFLGYHTNVAEIYNCADIFLFPSKREGLGLAAIEAMATGLPIITSNVGGITEYSIDGKTGYTFNCDDIDGFANAIVKLEKDIFLRQKMGEYNRFAAQKYDIQYAKKITGKIYTEIISI